MPYPARRKSARSAQVAGMGDGFCTLLFAGPAGGITIFLSPLQTFIEIFKKTMRRRMLASCLSRQREPL